MAVTRPRSLAFAAFVLALRCEVHAAPFAYVANIGSDNVSVIDTATDTVVATISTGVEPAQLVAAPDGKRVFVTNYQSGSVSVIDTERNIVSATIALGSRPFDIALSADATRAFVTQEPFGGALAVIDTQSATVVGGPFALGMDPQDGILGVRVTPDGGTAYVTAPFRRVVGAFNTATGERVATIPIPLGGRPFPIAMSPDGTTAYVGSENTFTCGDPGTVWVIDTRRNSLTDTVSGAAPNVFGAAIHAMSMTANGAKLYAAITILNEVLVIDTATRSIARIDLSPLADGCTLGGGGVCPGKGFAVTPDGTKAYVTLGPIDSSPAYVAVIDATTNTLTDTRIPVGGNPFAIVVAGSCQDGVVQTGEECDDGNGVAGDGCGPACRVEGCFACAGEPSVCTPAPDSTPCDDKDPCRIGDTCTARICAGAVAGDADGDAVPDTCDNCPGTFNPDQFDADGRGGGDLCDPCPFDASDRCTPDQTAATTLDGFGGVLSTPDGTLTLSVPAGTLAGPTSLSVTGGVPVVVQSRCGVEEPRVTLMAYLAPEGRTFDPPIHITLRWPDPDDDGIVDGSDPPFPESEFQVWRNGMAATGRCGDPAYAPGTCTSACCDTEANTWTVEATEFSEFVLWGQKLLSQPPSSTTTTTTSSSTTSTTLGCGSPTGSAATRAVFEASCAVTGRGCPSAANHGDYVKCIKEQVKAAVGNGNLPLECRGAIVRCAARSTCGKPGFVTCCRTDVKGTTKCSMKNGGSKCRAPAGGSACIGSFASCCDACPASGCSVPAP